MKNNLVKTLLILLCLVMSFSSKTSELTFDLESLGLDRDHVFSSHWDKDFLVERDEREAPEFVFTEADFRQMAMQILLVERSIAEEFSVGDGLTFALYIMKVFAEIGDYDLTQDELKALFSTFTKLTQLEIPPVAIDIVDQLERIQFVRREAASTVIFHTITKRAIHIDMSEYDEEPSSTSEGDFDKIRLAHLSSLSFQSIRSIQQKIELIDFVLTPFKLPILPRKWFARFNQIYPGMESRIRQYTQIDDEIEPMKVRIQGLSVNVDAGSVLGVRDFQFNEAFLTPGIKDANANPLPSFHVWASSGPIKVKSSVAE